MSRRDDDYPWQDYPDDRYLAPDDYPRRPPQKNKSQRRSKSPVHRCLTLRRGYTPTAEMHVSERNDTLEEGWECMDGLHFPVPREDIENRCRVWSRNRLPRRLLDGDIERNVMTMNARPEGPNVERGETKRRSGTEMI